MFEQYDLCIKIDLFEKKITRKHKIKSKEVVKKEGKNRGQLR